MVFGCFLMVIQWEISWIRWLNGDESGDESRDWGKFQSKVDDLGVAYLGNHQMDKFVADLCLWELRQRPGYCQDHPTEC